MKLTVKKDLIGQKNKLTMRKVAKMINQTTISQMAMMKMKIGRVKLITDENDDKCGDPMMMRALTRTVIAMNDCQNCKTRDICKIAAIRCPVCRGKTVLLFLIILCKTCSVFDSDICQHIFSLDKQTL